MAFAEMKDGTKLFYRDWGTGKPVVLIHGWCISGDSWEYVMNDLPRRGLRCIAYDQRGCGRSDQPWTGHDYDTLADDLAELLDQLHLREVTLVGHSMGGGVIARYLARHGEARVARAVLVGATTPFLLKTEDNPEGIDGAYFDAMVAAIRKDRAGYVGSLVPGFFGSEAQVSPEMGQWGIELTLQASPQAAVEMLRANVGTDQRDELTKITVPTLVIHGDYDLSCPLELTARRTAALIPNSRLEVYEGKAHGIYITDAPRLNDDLFAFIRATEA